MSDDPRSSLPPAVEVLQRGLDAEALEEAVLVLSALGVPHAVFPDGDEVVLVVDSAYAEQARRELSDHARDRLVEPPAPALLGGARAGLPAALALLAGHFGLLLLSAARRGQIYSAGELDAVRVQAGEVWRAFTALTLHADPAHVVGNAIATAIFVSAAGDWVGPGLALLLTILAGGIGNIAAVEIDGGHLAIGFSTATFGALGLVAVFGFVARFRDRWGRRRAWLALGAGLALLAMLGAGERSDLLAHLLGLAAGAGLGALVARGRLRGVSGSSFMLTQLACALFALGIIVASWLLALRHVP